MPNFTAVYVEWIESERGWGMRPDGCSVHISMEEWMRYFREFKSKQPKEVPNEYSFPSDPRPIDITDASIIERLQEKKSIRFWNSSEERHKLEKML